jgi:hypothetical protein
METKTFDLGEVVVCDLCGVDYTFSDAVGGMLFGSNGCCPECTGRMKPDVIKHDEEKYIRARANEGETFRAFCLRMRGGDNSMTIYTADGVEGLFE